MDKITVLMTTYNETKEIISQAIESILSQSYKSFRFLIIIDNKDNAEAVNTVEDYARRDSRIEILINAKNLGLPASLNRGIDNINTKYIARMDADDVSVPNRLERQLKYMEEHPLIDLIGSNIFYSDAKGNITSHRAAIPTEDSMIKQALKYVNIFHHPTFFGKTRVFKKYRYRLLRYSQDYDLTCRLAEDGRRLANIPDCLLIHRTGDKISKEKLVIQRITFYCIQKQYKSHRLIKCNIVNEINQMTKDTNMENEYESIQLYKRSIESLKSKKFISFLICIFKSSKESIITKHQIKGLLMYCFRIKYKNKTL